MKIILISRSDDSETEIATVIKLFENGLPTFHLRKPKYTSKQLKNYIQKIPKQFHNRIIIHSHHFLALKFNLKGVHLGRRHLKRKYLTGLKLKLLTFRKPHLIVTTSFTKLLDLYETNTQFDYVFLSPIFDSLTSQYQSGFTEHTLKTAMEKTSFKVIARGGIDSSRMERVKEVGFEGMALYSSIWKKPDPVSEYISLKEKSERLGIPIED